MASTTSSGAQTRTRSCANLQKLTVSCSLSNNGRKWSAVILEGQQLLISVRPECSLRIARRGRHRGVFHWIDPPTHVARKERGKRKIEAAGRHGILGCSKRWEHQPAAKSENRWRNRHLGSRVKKQTMQDEIQLPNPADDVTCLTGPVCLNHNESHGRSVQTSQKTLEHTITQTLVRN